jgi:chromosome segregation ATPase
MVDTTAALIDQQHEIADLQRELAQSREVVAELDGVAERLAAVERENEELKADLQTEQIDNEAEVSIMHDEYDELERENERLREAARPFVRAGEAIGEVRMGREDHYLWVQSHGDPRNDVKISLADCDRLRAALDRDQELTYKEPSCINR